ncbi:hypothetical protein CHLNCDRAFT_145635 [Chlorella variabilis]|nr:hypothetical protein CHLNCDRAFT_145635 [Chlorella variabilis]EFN50614.1 hypothetical protein CHLNCDRAFT_145635 [Chlorella variabilis]|eukprot:XP_005842736.1 hypothetical protein CHLNCDRAFT_145635 [Chlorella variabilis]
MYTRFLSGPFGLQPKENMTFTFTDLDSAGQAAQVFSAHQCWLEAVGGASAAAYVDCTSPVALPADTKDGSYHFHARVAGANGAAGTEALSTFEVDSVPPEVSIAEPPGAPSSPMLRSNATSVAFNSSEEGVSFYCGLSRSDPGAPAPAAPDASAYYWCTSPAALTNLTDGNYMFAVYAVDGVGNQGKPATSTFLVDITPPAFSDINVPTATAQPEITVAFTATDSG